MMPRFVYSLLSYFIFASTPSVFAIRGHRGDSIGRGSKALQYGGDGWTGEPPRFRENAVLDGQDATASTPLSYTGAGPYLPGPPGSASWGGSVTAEATTSDGHSYSPSPLRATTAVKIAAPLNRLIAASVPGGSQSRAALDVLPLLPAQPLGVSPLGEQSAQQAGQEGDGSPDPLLQVSPAIDTLGAIQYGETPAIVASLEEGFSPAPNSVGTSYPVVRGVVPGNLPVVPTIPLGIGSPGAWGPGSLPLPSSLSTPSPPSQVTSTTPASQASSTASTAQASSTASASEPPSTTPPSEAPSTTPASEPSSTTPAARVPSTPVPQVQSTAPAAQAPSTAPAPHVPSSSPASEPSSTAPAPHVPSSSPASEPSSTAPAPQAPSTTPASQVPSTTQASQVPSTTPASQVPSTTPSSQVPSTTPASQVPSTTPASQAPSTTPASQAPSTTPASQVPSTTPASQVPSTTSQETPATPAERLQSAVATQSQMGGENQAVSAAAAHPETSAADPSAAYQLGGASPSTLTSPGARDAAASSATVEGTGTEVPSPGPPPGSVQVVNSNVSSAAHIVAPGGEASGRSISALSPEGAPGLTDAGHGGDSSKPGEAPASKETSVADPVASDRQKNWGTAGTAEQEAKLSTGTLPLKPDLDDGKSTPAGTTSSGAVSRTTEGQPGGAEANSEEANSREEPPETQGHVCFDRCDCVPVIAGGVAAFLVCFAMVSLAALLMSTVFSKGFFSPVFFRGGGYAILLASALGLTAGGLLGGLVRPCWPRILYCGGGLMAFAAAFVFLGKRGAAVGAVGGLVTGGSIGALIVPAPLSVALGCVVGFLLGLVFGFAPIFRELKMNSRYIRYGLENSQQSREGSMGSPTLRTDSFYTAAGRRSPSRMFSSPTRPATLRSNGSLSYEIDNDKRRADSLPFPIS